MTWRRRVTELAVAAIREIFAPDAFDAVAGAETAGIPFAVLLADQLGLKLRYVRKRPLGIGRYAQVEGGPVEGLRVLLVDDLTTDGTSKLAFARGLRAAGATVEHVLTVFYHDAFPGAGARLADARLMIHPLATWSDVLAASPRVGLADPGQPQAAGAMPAAERAEIERFLADPVAWSTRHGGRARA